MNAIDHDRISGAARPINAIGRFLAGFEKGEIGRWTLRGLLLGAIVVLLGHLHDIATARSDLAGALPPAMREGTNPEPASATDPRDAITTAHAVLQAPMGFALRPGGRLEAVGSIDAGAAARLAAALSEHGGLVTTVSLNSPGGSLDDAIAMSRLIREKGLAAEVAAGALCASSCPLMLAGGERRSVDARAAIGLHQFYALGEGPLTAVRVMADAQTAAARIARHLTAMGVDPALWLHALETPPQALYYLSREEMRAYRLVTPETTLSRLRG